MIKISTDKNTIMEILLLFFTCVSVTFLFGNTRLSGDNFNYAIEEIHAYDNTLYQNNINIEGADYSPRLYANRFMSAMMRMTNSSWADSALLLIRVNYILYAIAIMLITVRLFKSNRLLCGTVLSICCMSGALISLGFNLNSAYDVFFGTATALLLIAIGMVAIDEKKWDLAWILLTLAEFMHVHEGIWGGCVVGVIWIADCIVEKKIRWRDVRVLPLYIAAVLLVVLPSLLNTEVVDENLFIQIYVFIRTPHHLLVSAWGLVKIAASIMMLFGGLYILFRDYKKNSKEKIKRYMMEYGLLLALWLILLMAEYVCTEVLSVSAVATMYIPKCFKYITWIGALIYVKYGLDSIFTKKYIQGIALIGIVLVPYESGVISTKLACVVFVVLFVVYAIFERYSLDEKIFVSGDDGTLALLTWILIINAMFYRIYLSAGYKKCIYALPILAVVTFEGFVKQRVQLKKIANIFVVFGLLISFIASSAGFIYTINGRQVSYVNGEAYVRNFMGDDVYDLAEDFREMTDKNTVFLADPYSYLGNVFQLVSNRSCYAIYKNTPSSKSAVIKWYNRIEAVKNMTSCSALELKQLMVETELDYVLISKDRFEEIENSGFFDIAVKNETLGVYMLIE